MEWSEAHDVLLCREMLALNPFKAKRKTTQRSKMWETIAQNLELIDQPTFRVTVRAVRDRYSLLARKYRKRMQTEKKASGITPEVSELDVLLEELIGLEDLSEEENEEKTKKDELDKVKALDMRKKAMEKLSDTKNRKAQEADGEPKKKARRSSGATIEYLKERNEVEFDLRRQELELKKKEQVERSKKEDEAAKRQEDLMKVMAQQNQMMMNLISKFFQK